VGSDQHAMRASTHDPMMIQMHSFREQPAIVRKIIAFVAIAMVLYWLLGPIGILYALGFGALFLLIVDLSVDGLRSAFGSQRLLRPNRQQDSSMQKSKEAKPLTISWQSLALISPLRCPPLPSRSATGPAGRGQELDAGR